MSNSTILDVIEHYQKSIDRSADDEQRLLHCINKLYKLPVKVEHLQQTGIGKTINSLRKYNGEIGVAAKALVAKWKAMVAAEEVSLQPQCNNNGYDSNHSTERDSSDDNKNNVSRSMSNSQSTNSNKNQKNEKTSSSHKIERSHHNEKHSSSKHKSITSSHSKEKNEGVNKDIKNEKNYQTHPHENERGHRKQIFESEERRKKNTEKAIDQNSKSYTQKHINNTDNSNKDNTRKSKSQPLSPKAETESEHTKTAKLNKEKNTPNNSSKADRHHSDKKLKSDEHHKDKSSSSSGKERNAHSSSSKHSSKKTNSTDIKSSDSKASKHKRHRDTDNEQSDVKQPNLKIAKTENQTNYEDEEDTADGFDSSMGANFADVLGMLNVPTVKNKKINNSMKASSSNLTLNKSSTEKSSQKRGQQNIIETKKPQASSLSSSTVVGSKATPNKKPDLLSSCAKLEPLDPNIALELPTTSISTNYKPMPLNQTVMDCVFKTSNSSASKAQTNYALSEADAITHGISSKTMRTKIYSGVKTGQIFQVPTLFDLCIRILQKHIDALEYTGGVPFEVLRPVLERATPQQLFVFEDFNPYLMEDTDILWQQHCQRSYRLQKRQEMETWREMFLRCQEDQERKLSILAESIKQSQKIIAAPIRKTQLAFVDSMVKPPRNVQRKQEQYGTKSKLTATPASRVAALSSVTPNAAKSGDSRLRVAGGLRDTAQVSTGIARPKKAPLMAKTLQFMRGRLKR
ncbi:transcription elongation factor B polypeptide 3 [Teleopsis dalmanni]|uniref:transcription elongation factor B polypeptide 3 n=1 Tax=Teleopsis dalmanni TaxID=139649 RepID=UPI0018CE1C1E|nr:transcription elongation factor B polypeptide 3 [Teleopsis dalmanni]